MDDIGAQVEAVLAQRTLERFFRLVVRDPETGCWEWLGAKLPAGYGKFGHVPHRSTLAHRWLYNQLVGPIPVGKVLDHFKCQNTSCVNFAHVEPVTQRVNLLRGPTTLPAIAAAKTACPVGHPYTGRNSFGKRYCQTCDTLRHRKKYQEMQAEVEQLKAEHRLAKGD